MCPCPKPRVRPVRLEHAVLDYTQDYILASLGARAGAACGGRAQGWARTPPSSSRHSRAGLELSRLRPEPSAVRPLAVTSPCCRTPWSRRARKGSIRIHNIHPATYCPCTAPWPGTSRRRYRAEPTARHPATRLRHRHVCVLRARRRPRRYGSVECGAAEHSFPSARFPAVTTPTP
jgi:hypothetical protein